MTGEKLTKILDLVESLDWRYIPDTSKYDEYPNNKYTASKGNLEFDIYFGSLYVYEGHGEDRKQILSVSDKNERVKNLREKLQLKTSKEMRQQELDREKKEKREKAGIKRQGYEGDIDVVLKNL